MICFVKSKICDTCFSLRLEHSQNDNVKKRRRLLWKFYFPCVLIVYYTFSADVISEEVILKWYKESHSQKGKSVFLEQMKKFVDWLQNAETGKYIKLFSNLKHASIEGWGIVVYCASFTVFTSRIIRLYRGQERMRRQGGLVKRRAQRFFFNYSYDIWLEEVKKKLLIGFKILR